MREQPMVSREAHLTGTGVEYADSMDSVCQLNQFSDCLFLPTGIPDDNQRFFGRNQFRGNGLHAFVWERRWTHGDPTALVDLVWLDFLLHDLASASQVDGPSRRAS